MRLAIENNEVSVNGAVQTANYAVQNNAQMMVLLSKNLYKNQILAPIRELSSNANDAHLAAGNAAPFDVYLPTYDNLTFKIRDYGTGMSKDKMFNMYRFYGASDKTNSNEFTGCMGIGSKSPFAYGDMFTSASYYNGVKYVYINSRGEDGVPILQFMGEFPTDEPNGMEIEFNVRSNDQYNFVSEATELYRWFDVKPNVRRGKLNDISVTTPNYEGENWRVVPTNNSVAIMGCVAYPIDENQFVDPNVKSDNWNKYKQNSFSELIHYGVELRFEIGDIEIDASREGLQYTAKTISAIKAKLKTIEKHVSDKMSEQYKEAKSLWQVRRLCASNFNVNFAAIFKKNIQWEGKKFDPDVTDQDDYTNYNILHYYKRSYRRKIENGKFYNASSTIIPKTILMVNDIVAKAYGMCKWYCGQHTDAHIVLIPNDEDSLNHAKEVFGAIDDDFVFASKYYAEYSEWRKENRSSGGGSGYRTIQVSRWAGTYWEDTKVNMAEVGYYVERKRDDVKLNGRWVSLNTINDILKELKTLKVDFPTNIVAVRTASIKKFIRNWKPIENWLNKVIHEQVSDEVNKAHTYLAHIIHNGHYLHFRGGWEKREDNLYDKMLELNDTYTDESLTSVKNLCQYANIKLTIDKEFDAELTQLYKDFHNKCPLIDMLQHYYDSKQLKVVHDYIIEKCECKEEIYA
jgi:hypothetical protein